MRIGVLSEFTLAFCMVVSPALLAAIPSAIPRASTHAFLSEGLFEGGKNIRASIDSIRVAKHEAKSGDRSFERWVLDFSDAEGKQKGFVAPKFQLQYLKSESFVTDSGDEVVRRPAKFLLLLRSITKNGLDQSEVRKAAQRSALVKDVILYPPIEEGDMAIELVLKRDVLFEAHQPVERQGRLVLDLKPSTLN